jgi:hypothetical protein
MSTRSRLALHPRLAPHGVGEARSGPVQAGRNAERPPRKIMPLWGMPHRCDLGCTQERNISDSFSMQYDTRASGVWCDDSSHFISACSTINEMGAFMVVRAESQEAAAKLFEKHPHFTIFPGESVEVMPVPPIPGG